MTALPKTGPNRPWSRPAQHPHLQSPQHQLPMGSTPPNEADPRARRPAEEQACSSTALQDTSSFPFFVDRSLRASAGKTSREHLPGVQTSPSAKGQAPEMARRRVPGSWNSGTGCKLNGSSSACKGSSSVLKHTLRPKLTREEAVAPIHLVSQVIPLFKGKLLLPTPEGPWTRTLHPSWKSRLNFSKRHSLDLELLRASASALKISYKP